MPDPPAVLAFYEALGVAHFGSSFRDAKANVHKFGGVKQMGDLDGSITLHFNNDHNVKRLPEFPLMVDNSTQLGTLTTRNGRVFILGKKNGPVCKDKNCRGFGGHHEANCKENAIVRKVRNNRIVASKKEFEEKMQGAGAAKVLAILELMKTTYQGDICKGYRGSGIPRASRTRRGAAPKRRATTGKS